MTEENPQDTRNESQDTGVQNKPQTPSNDGLLSEVMAKKDKIKALEAELAKRDANDEKRRTKKLEDEGKLQEVISELRAVNEKQSAQLELQDSIVNNYKQNLVNGLTSDEERKEYLSTKSVDFLEELNKEKSLLQPQNVNNPKESIGAVRSSQDFSDINFKDMSAQEKVDNWGEIVNSFKPKT
tara:strand:- start:5519 stop:6067 length:549 start_codon:yes stop_codon:yes gene_type:complete